MHQGDTIAALSSPPGRGALAVVRLSGPDAFVMAQAICPGLPDPLPDRSALFVRIVDEEGLIDEAVLTAFKGPRSYTGEDVVEFSVHGSPYVQQRLLLALAGQGARPAGPGEFTLRAFLNRKLDLSQAEAVADLIASESAAQHRMAYQQLRGGFSQRIETLRGQLIDLCALVELELDFSEEDVEFARRDDLLALLDELHAICTRLIASFRYGNAVRAGIPVAIVGAPNSGKSTLLNTLLQEDRALVSEIPGTTRDTVEETITLGGVLFRFIDTAGLRDTDDTVERMGIERSYRKAADASVVILLADATTRDAHQLRADARALAERLAADAPQRPPLTLLPVMNKADLVAQHTADVLHVSARLGTGIDALKEALVAHVAALRTGSEDLVVSNVRHVEALRLADMALLDARKGVVEGISGELLAIDLRKAQHHLGEITGRITTDDLLGSIFGRFCIGK